MIARTTTDGAFDAVAVAGLEAMYGSIARLNREWGTSLPEVSEPKSPRERWAPVIAVIREARCVAKLDEKSLEQKMGTLEGLNERAGRTAEKPDEFPDMDGGFDACESLLCRPAEDSFHGRVERDGVVRLP